MCKTSCALLLMLNLQTSFFFAHVPKMSPSLMWNECPSPFLAFLKGLEDGFARSNFSEFRKPNCNNQEQTDTFEIKTKQHSKKN